MFLTGGPVLLCGQLFFFPRIERVSFQKGMTVTARRARINDAFAFLTAVIIISLDQWTKSLVVAHLSPPDFGPRVPLINPYLTLYYIRNTGAAFNMFETNGPVLAVLILVAVAVIVYLYLRIFNTGALLHKLIFGLIIGGAVGNLLDRFTHGSVVDFIWFQIPQIHFNFAIFNLADAAISVGVVLLFIALIFGGTQSRKKAAQTEQQPIGMEQTLQPAAHSQEHDAQH